VTILQHAVETSRPMVASHGHALSVSLPGEPIEVDADAVRLAQVFCNLLNNACKYTPRGGQVTLAAERQSNEVVVRVRDSGIGIPNEKLTNIFEMFMQVDRSLERSHGGLGIGLTLVDRLLALHGGSIEAHSEGIGRGSEFIARLPVAERAFPAETPAPAQAASPSMNTACRILVADDNRDAATTLGTLLRMRGHDVRTAFDGQEACEVAADFRPDVVLLDIGMPRRNGYDAARQIRLEPWGQEVLLVALTGWGKDEDKQLSKEAGFDHHLVKPVDPQQLDAVLAEPREPA
jgi:CheY-like chemotaxis protein